MNNGKGALVRSCLACGADIAGPGVFRIKIGGVTYQDNGNPLFVQDTEDCFPDHSKIKWLCGQCAEAAELYIDELEFEVCKAHDGGYPCGRTFQPVEEEDSESVVRIEWGTITRNKTNKGASEFFVPSEGGHLHYWCCAEGYELPFHAIPYMDEP